MANRYRTNHIVQEGKYKGYRRDDADDAYWSVGYTLPKLPNYQGWRMRTFCIKSVSDNHLNIEALPTLLRTLVNKYHAEYGVGRVENVNTFNVRCCNHQDESVRRCRQCRARRDTVKLVLQTKLKMEITHGLLVRTGWEPPKEEDEKDTAKGGEEATATTFHHTKRTLKTNWQSIKGNEDVRVHQEKQAVSRKQTKGERIKVLMAHMPTVKIVCGKDTETKGNSSGTEKGKGTLETEQKATRETKENRNVDGAAAAGEAASQIDKETPKESTKMDLSPSQQKGNYPCGGCGRGYKYKRNLARHVKGQHEVPGENSSEEQEEQAILCRDSSLMGNRKILKCVRLSKHAQIPTRGTYRSVGHDLYSAYDYTISAGGQVLVKTDLQIAMPPGCYGRIAPRSSLAHPHGIDVGAGVIDPDYRGNIGIVLFNLGQHDYTVKRGDRCAQVILEQVYVPLVVEVESLEETSRGGGGSFGSTGK